VDVVQVKNALWYQPRKQGLQSISVAGTRSLKQGQALQYEPHLSKTILQFSSGIIRPIPVEAVQPLWKVNNSIAAAYEAKPEVIILKSDRTLVVFSGSDNLFPSHHHRGMNHTGAPEPVQLLRTEWMAQFAPGPSMIIDEGRKCTYHRYVSIGIKIIDLLLEPFCGRRIVCIMPGKVLAGGAIDAMVQSGSKSLI
jgi:hypothetical protein